MADDEAGQAPPVRPRQAVPGLDATSDRAFDALTESQQLSEGAQLLLATALVDAVQGRNEHHRYASMKRDPDAAMLAFLEDSAPMMISRIATIQLHTRSDQRSAIDVLAETLRGFKGDNRPKNPLKALLGR